MCHLVVFSRPGVVVSPYFSALELKIPLLILHGEADKLVPPAGSRKFFEKVNLNDKELQIYPGGYHEPHNDIEHETVLKDLERWLKCICKMI